MLHVHTFNDLSEANLAPTWGLRYAQGKRDKVFAHSNPYRTVHLSDHFGKSARIPNPAAEDKEHKQITIAKAYWFGSDQTPAWVKENGGIRLNDGTGHLLVRGTEWFEGQDHLQYKLFMLRADPHFVFRAKGRPEVKGSITMSFFTAPAEQVRDMEILIPPKEFAKMAKGVPYTIHPVNGNRLYQWKIVKGVTITRK
jgi:hypothetical protein